MGYIEIPGIRVSLPLYHGTSEAVLQVAAGHIEGSSLPVGGKGTHCAISGHRGLPSAKLFTDLDKMKEGDTFSLKVLNETLTYQVDHPGSRAVRYGCSGDRPGAGLLHAGHLYALWDQYPPAADKGTQDRNPGKRTGEPSGSGNHGNRTRISWKRRNRRSPDDSWRRSSYSPCSGDPGSRDPDHFLQKKKSREK